ncbi:hypothetical protein ABID16_003378 [Rhizobium aquaticum]|uniref:Uncharacterized protein n=1 Tax=Rhizobium aquaticum TaxID=1549636 RepID=A0ABV2J4Y1_9HYPH
MSTTTALRYSGYFSPSELSDIEKVVKDVCLDVDDHDGSHSSQIAGQAIKMYQNGVNDLSVMRNRLRLISQVKRPL